MLTPAGALVAHAGDALAPHDLWSAWNPVLVVALAVAAVVVMKVRPASRHRGSSRWRHRCGALALVVLALALASPLDALSGALVSAHMVQHVLLVLVAAPLLAVGAPAAAVLAATPRRVRSLLGRASRHPAIASVTRALRWPVLVWLLHASALWVWHSAALYEAALRHPLLHVLEHAIFLGTALLFWNLVLGAGRRRIAGLAAVLLVFTMALQSVFLSALITFAPTPWYPSYGTSATAWGLSPLTDQQLAGLIMWIPAGLIYAGFALGVLATWLERTHRESDIVLTR